MYYNRSVSLLEIYNLVAFISICHLLCFKKCKNFVFLHSFFILSAQSVTLWFNYSILIIFCYQYYFTLLALCSSCYTITRPKFRLDCDLANFS